MKKIFLIFVLIFISTSLFAIVWKEGVETVETFLGNTKYVKIIVNKNNITYIPFDSIGTIDVDEDDIKIFIKTIPTSDTESEYNLDIDDWDMTFDENGSLIFSKK